MSDRRRRRGHGEGTIFQRSDGRWEGKIDLGWKDGRRVRKSYYAETRGEVQEKLTKALHDQDRGIGPTNGSSPTLAVFMADWLKSIQSTVRTRSMEKYTSVVSNHILPALGKIKLEKLTAQRIQALLDAKLAAGLSPASVTGIKLVLSHALTQATRWDLVPRNVASLVRGPKTQRHEWIPLDVDQARRFIATCHGGKLEALYILALSTGLRRGEALGLKWDDVDLDLGTISIKRSLQRTSTRGVVFEPPKTALSRRTIKIGANVKTALKTHRTRQLEARLAAGMRWQDTGSVFTTSIGTPLDPRALTIDFRRTLAKAGLPLIRFHDLRHSAATLALAQGIHPKVVAEMLGHSRISLTLDVYSHALPNLQSEAAEKMSSVLAS
jgi:integrase